MRIKSLETQKSTKSKVSWKWIILVSTLLICLVSFATLSWAKGQGWTVYKENNSGLGDNHVSTLVIDSQGQVWVGTSGGLSVLDTNGKWILYDKNNSGLASDIVNDLAIDSQGQVWIGTYGGVSLFDINGNWTHYPVHTSFSVENLTTDPQGGIWFSLEKGSGEGLFTIPPGGEITQYTPINPGMVDNGIWSLAIDPHGRIWVGKFSGLSVLAPDGTWTIPADDKSVVIEKVWALAFDPQGRVWAGTTESGVCTLSQENYWICFNRSNSNIPGNSISQMKIDRQGRVWAVTDDNPFLDANVASFNVLNPDGQWTTNLSGYPINDLAFDPRGQVWVGLSYGGLGVLSPDGQWIIYDENNSRLAHDDSDAIEMAAMYDPTGWSTHNVNTMAIDAQGHIWVGTSYGVFEFDQSASVQPSIISGIDVFTRASAAIVILQVLIFAPSFLVTQFSKMSKKTVNKILIVGILLFLFISALGFTILCILLYKGLPGLF